MIASVVRMKIVATATHNTCKLRKRTLQTIPKRSFHFICYLRNWAGLIFAEIPFGVVSIVMLAALKSFCILFVVCSKRFRLDDPTANKEENNKHTHTSKSELIERNSKENAQNIPL